MIGLGGAAPLWLLLSCQRAAPAVEPTAPLVGVEWEALAPGMERVVIRLPLPSLTSDQQLHAVRLDPHQIQLELRMATRDGPARTLSEWAQTAPDDASVAVINSSMFQEDYLRNVGLMIDGDHINHSEMAPEQNSLLVADPVEPSSTRFKLYNLGCESLEEAKANYRLFVQSIRMIGCDGENVWKQQPRLWSAALIGQDHAERLLFLHVRSPYTMHDLVEMLLTLPLDLKALHYGDGGPPAGLYIRSGETEILRLGSYETGIQEDDENQTEWALPNVLMALSSISP